MCLLTASKKGLFIMVNINPQFTYSQLASVQTSTLKNAVTAKNPTLGNGGVPVEGVKVGGTIPKPVVPEDTPDIQQARHAGELYFDDLTDYAPEVCARVADDKLNPGDTCVFMSQGKFYMYTVGDGDPKVISQQEFEKNMEPSDCYTK